MLAHWSFQVAPLAAHLHPTISRYMVEVDRKTENLMDQPHTNDDSNRVNLSVTIPPDVKEKIRLIAKRENNTVSRITENALRTLISDHPLFSASS